MISKQEEREQQREAIIEAYHDRWSDGRRESEVLEALSGTISSYYPQHADSDSGSDTGERREMESDQTSYRLKLGLCYLAGPIDAVTTGEAQGWRDRATVGVSEVGLATFSPAHAFDAVRVANGTDGVTGLCEAIEYINTTALVKSAVVLANLEKRSFGTPLECMMASGNGIPVFAFGGSPHSIYKHHFNCWATNVEAAIRELVAWWTRD